MMPYLLLLLVAPAVFGEEKVWKTIADKPTVPEPDPVELPTLEYTDIFAIPGEDCGFIGQDDCEGINPCGEPCPEGTTCRFFQKVLQCIPDDVCNAQLDVCFVLDMSGSIGSSNFALLIAFVKSFVFHATLSPTAVKMAMARFANFADLDETRPGTAADPWNFNAAAASNAALANARLTAINGEYSFFPLGSSTAIARGLRQCKQRVFTTAGGDRPGVQNLVILLTDGRNNIGSDSDVEDEAAWLKMDGAEIIPVGIGNVDVDQLNTIATADEAIFADNFMQLADRIDDLLEAACT